jgi:riboflavin kinase/FMN adenylyltransferase
MRGESWRSEIHYLAMQTVKGIVIHGKKEGRKLGYPTANISLLNRLPNGVYAGEISLEGKKYKAGIFIPKEENILEAHILGWNGDLYGEEIEVQIIKRLRDISEFKSDRELKELISKDIEVISKM